MSVPESKKTEDLEPEVLDAESLAALEVGIRSEETGREYTWEEAKQFARERRQAWTIVPDTHAA